jgi:hypothetical protein
VASPAQTGTRPLYRFRSLGLLWISLLSAIAILIFGFYSEALFQIETWNQEGLRRFVRYTVAFWGVSAVFYAFGRRYYIPTLAFLIVSCSLYALGFAPVLATAFILAAAATLGWWLFRSDWILSALAGLSIFSLGIFVVSRISVHYPVVYLVILGSAFLLPGAGRQFLAKARCLSPKALGSNLAPSTYWSSCLFAWLLFAHWLIVLKPEAGADALSMHLAAAFDMATRHVFTLDFPQFVWALMPMGADFCYALAHTLGGEYAARLLNFAMLAYVAFLIYSNVRSWLAPGGALLLSSAFVSSPVVQLVTGTMMVENFIAAMALGAASALWRFHEQPRGGDVLLSAFLLGTAIGWKLGAVTLAATILPVLFFSLLRNWTKLLRPRATAVIAGAMFLVPAALPYVVAYVRSGNPIYPFANDFFQSPYLSEVLEDYRFREPLNSSTLFNITFRTNLYYEGLPGSFGFQYLLLLPVCLVGLSKLQSLKERSALATGLTGCVLIALSTPNARYFYPALAFLTVGFGAVLGRIRCASTPLYRVAMASLAVVIGLNAWFLPASNSYHRDFVPKPLFSNKGQHEYRAQAAPVREVIDYLNGQDGAVMFTETSDFAGSTSRVYINHWHNFDFNKRVQACRRPSDIHQLITSLGIRHFVASDQHDKFAVESAPALFKYLEICGEERFRAEQMSALAVRPDCEERLRRQDPTYVSNVLSTGTFDDMDARLNYKGTWQSTATNPGAYRRTLTFSNQPGAEIRFSFRGAALVYTFTKAFNRGRAQIEIDGEVRKVVDLYAKNIQWGVQEKFILKESGSHEMSIRVMPQKNAASTGRYVDLDSVTVEE